MDKLTVFAIFASAAMLLSFALFIDTTSWWIRSLASQNNVGLYISRSNIYLYGGRFFSLAFVIVVSFAVESGFSTADIALCCFLTFTLCTILQSICVAPNFKSGIIIKTLSRALVLPSKIQCETINTAYFFNGRLFYSTMFATFIFSLGSGAPLLLASIYIDYRLSMANIGQLINSLGMLAILFFVDQSLFRSLDSGLITIDIKTYTYGRVCGFFLSALLYFLIFWAL